MDSSAPSNKPVKVFRVRGITASVFANQTKKGDAFHKVCLQRTYWDGEKYQTSDTFGRDEVPVAQHVLMQAWQFVLTAEEAAKKSASEKK